MNRQNFNPETVGNYPLTIERMAEMQGDQQMPLEVIAGMCGGRDCIISGCETAGAAGYVLHNGEVFEVKAFSGMGAMQPGWLIVRSSEVPATNSDGEEVVVRVERWMEWSQLIPFVGAEAILPSKLPRLWTSLVKETPWEACVNNEIWVPVHPNNPNMSKLLPRVRKLRNGLVHVECDCVYASNYGEHNIMLPAGYIPYRTIEIPMTLTFPDGIPHYISARLSPNPNDVNGSHFYIPFPKVWKVSCQTANGVFVSISEDLRYGQYNYDGTHLQINTVFDQRFLTEQQ